MTDLRNAKARLDLAREALIGIGYFKPDEVDDDVAPRIIEYHSHVVNLLNEAATALRAVQDTDPCWYDHHGSCQAHGCGDPCGQLLVKEVLKKLNDYR